MTRDVADAAALLAVLEGRPAVDLSDARLAGARLVVPTDHFFQRTEDGVLAVFEAAVEALAKAGATIVREPVPEVLSARALIAKHGEIAGIEALATWRTTIDANPEGVSESVRDRLSLSADRSDHDYQALTDGLASLSEAFARRLATCDALIAPTVVCDPPAIQPLLESTVAYTLANAMALFNTAPGNWLRCTAATVPCGGARLPVGLMLMQRTRQEARILRLAAAVEAAMADVARPSMSDD